MWRVTYTGRCPLVCVEPTCSAERQRRPRSRPQGRTRDDANSGERNLQAKGLAQGWNGGWDTSSRPRLSYPYCTRFGMIERNRKVAGRRLNLDLPAMSSRHLSRCARVSVMSVYDERTATVPMSAHGTERLAAPIRQALLHLQLLIISADMFTQAKSDHACGVLLSDLATVVFFRKCRGATPPPSVSSCCPSPLKGSFGAVT
ncbi:hypothetical protein ABIB73_007612 [Bradyrhizobium sp. F1.4.3]